MISFYSASELQTLGLKRFGENVLISRHANIYTPSEIAIGDNVRIDDFCILSGSIQIHSHIHIAAGVYLFAGKAGIEMEDFTCLSGKCNVYAISDDYSGEFMSNAVLPDAYRRVTARKVVLRRHALVGAACTILPGVEIATGTSVGAHSLVLQSTEAWSIYAGSPARRLKPRSKKILQFEENFLKDWAKERERNKKECL